MVWIGAALGALGTLSSISSANKANKQYENNLDAALEIYDELLANSEKMHNQQLAAIKKGFGRAEGAVAGIEQAGLRSIQAFGRQAHGAASQRLVSSGLFGSSVGAGIASGIAGEQSRQAGNLYARVAGIRSGVIGQGTQAEAQSIGSKISSMTAIGTAKAKLQASIQPQSQDLSGILGSAGGLLDEFDFGDWTPSFLK